MDWSLSSVSPLRRSFSEASRRKGRNKKIIGAAVRTKDGIKPVFVSPGNLIDLETSIKIILSVSQGHMIPEPLRLAHIKSRKIAL